MKNAQLHEIHHRYFDDAHDLCYAQFSLYDLLTNGRLNTKTSSFKMVFTFQTIETFMSTENCAPFYVVEHTDNATQLIDAFNIVAKLL